MSTDKSDSLLPKMPNPACNRLREERIRLNKTQDQIAADLGISRKTWGKYEKGRTVPDMYMLEKLHNFGVDIFYLVTGNRRPVDFMNPEEEKLIRQYRNAEESVQFVIQSLFDALKL